MKPKNKTSKEIRVYEVVFSIFLEKVGEEGRTAQRGSRGARGAGGSANVEIDHADRRGGGVRPSEISERPVIFDQAQLRVVIVGTTVSSSDASKIS